MNEANYTRSQQVFNRKLCEKDVFSVSDMGLSILSDICPGHFVLVSILFGQLAFGGQRVQQTSCMWAKFIPSLNQADWLPTQKS